MAEENSAGEGAAQVDAGAGEAAANQGGEGQGAEGTGAEGGGNNAAGNGGEGTPTEPPVRGGNVKDHIIERKDSKIEKLQAEIDSLKGAGGDGGGDAGQGTDINDAVNNHPAIKAVNEMKLASEIDGFISREGNEGFREHKAKIMEFANHPSRKNVPIETIAMEVVGRDGLLKMGANAEADASRAAAMSATGGGSARGSGGATIPPAGTPEFQAYKAEQIAAARNN